MSAHEYPHSVGPAVIGVQVDRGSAIPDLAGAYDPIDMTGPVWARGSDGVGQLDVQAGGVQTSFRRGQDGELYLLTRDNGLFELEPA